MDRSWVEYCCSRSKRCWGINVVIFCFVFVFGFGFQTSSHKFKFLLLWFYYKNNHKIWNRLNTCTQHNLYSVYCFAKKKHFSFVYSCLCTLYILFVNYYEWSTEMNEPEWGYKIFYLKKIYSSFPRRKSMRWFCQKL